MRKITLFLGLAILLTGCIGDNSTKNNNSNAEEDNEKESVKISKIDGVNFPALSEKLIADNDTEKAKITLQENKFKISKGKEARLTGKKNNIFVSFPALLMVDNDRSVMFSFSEEYWEKQQDEMLKQFEDYGYIVEEDNYVSPFGLGRTIQLNKNDYDVYMGLDLFGSHLEKTYMIRVLQKKTANKKQATPSNSSQERISVEQRRIEEERLAEERRQAEIRARTQSAFGINNNENIEVERTAVEQRRREEAEQRRIEEARLAEIRSRTQGSFESSSGTGSGSSTGTSSITSSGTNKGISTETPFKLGNRKAEILAKPTDNAAVEGTIVVDITVDEKGNIIEATIGSKTTITETTTRTAVLEAARKSKFSKGDKTEIGTITYIFTVN